MEKERMCTQRAVYFRQMAAFLLAAVIGLSCGGCGIVRIPSERTQAEEPAGSGAQPVIRPEETHAEPTPVGKMYDDGQFLLHHAQIVELYEKALTGTDIPLQLDMESQLLSRNVIGYDVLCGDAVAAKILFTNNPGTAQLQKIHFTDTKLWEKGGSLTEAQVQSAAKLCMEVCHGNMTEAEWKTVDAATECTLLRDDRTGETGQMRCANLDGVTVYHQGTNWAIAITEAMDPATGTVRE